jgi:hypothetical protein
MCEIIMGVELKEFDIATGSLRMKEKNGMNFLLTELVRQLLCTKITSYFE